jgi:hypothetical protein
MNHTRSVYRAPDGLSFPFQTWEVRQGGFRRTALLLTDGFLPAEAFSGLRELLLARYFKIYAPAFPGLRSGGGKPPGLRELGMGLLGFLRSVSEKDGGVPVAAIVASVLCLPFLACLSKEFPRLESIALLSPLADFSRPPFAVPLFLRRWVTLRAAEDALGDAEELKAVEGELRTELRAPKRLIRDMRGRAEPPVARKGDLVAAFVGEADPLLAGNPADAWLKACGAELHSYPRGRHLLFFDKHSKNVLRDLGAFLDRTAAKKASR